MKKTLPDVIFASEKRKNTLLLLQDGAKEMEEILISLSTTRQALLPQIRVLEEHYLIEHSKDSYKLAPIGKIIIDRMLPLINTIDILDIYIDYWGSHKLDFIPVDTLKKIKEIRNCAVIEPSMTELFELNKKYMNETYESKFLFTMTTFLHPQFKDIYFNLVDSGVHVSLILSYELFQKTRAESYADLKQLVSKENIQIFVYNKPLNLVTFSANNYSLILRLLTISGEYDNRQLILEGSSAVNWGKYLFEYYLKDSASIKEI